MAISIYILHTIQRPIRPNIPLSASNCLKLLRCKKSFKNVLAFSQKETKFPFYHKLATLSRFISENYSKTLLISSIPVLRTMDLLYPELL